MFPLCFRSYVVGRILNYRLIANYFDMIMSVCVYDTEVCRIASLLAELVHELYNK